MEKGNPPGGSALVSRTVDRRWFDTSAACEFGDSQVFSIAWISGVCDMWDVEWWTNRTELTSFVPGCSLLRAQQRVSREQA